MHEEDKHDEDAVVVHDAVVVRLTRDPDPLKAADAKCVTHNTIITMPTLKKKNSGSVPVI